MEYKLFIDILSMIEANWFQKLYIMSVIELKI
jgi:hypothetical protein